MTFNQWFRNEFPEHEDGCLYGKIALENAWNRASKEYLEENTKLKDKVEMLEFFYEANGFNKRGLHNSIQIAEYINKLEAQIEKMRNCRNCKNYKVEGICGGFTQLGFCKIWEMQE